MNGTRTEHALSFEILIDIGNVIANRFGLMYELDHDLIEQLLKWSVDLSARHMSDKFELPIPATYVIDNKGIVTYSFIEEDYSVRAEPDVVYNEYKKLL